MGNAQKMEKSLFPTRCMPGRVLCIYPWKAPKSEHKTSGGVIVIEGAAEKEKPQSMKVILSGVEGVKEGNQVFFNKYAGSTFEIEGQEYLSLKQEEILGVL